MFAALQRLFGLCRHDAMWREHRELDGRQVVYFVCDCGYAVPVLERTDEEYAALQKIAPPTRSGRV